jgi:hypothetical protein
MLTADEKRVNISVIEGSEVCFLAVANLWRVHEHDLFAALIWQFRF